MSRLKQPMMLRAAVREFGIPYQQLRRAAMRGLVPAEHVDGWYWFVERAAVRRFAAQKRARRNARRPS